MASSFSRMMKPMAITPNKEAMGTTPWANSSSHIKQMDVPMISRVRLGGCQSYLRKSL